MTPVGMERQDGVDSSNAIREPQFRESAALPTGKAGVASLPLDRRATSWIAGRKPTIPGA
jgi:hypothetical protein